MDDSRFDALARALAEPWSRRRVLATGAAAAAALLGLAPGPAAAAVCKGEGKACKKSSQCCGGLECLPSMDGPKNRKAASGSTAGSGMVCTAAAGGTCSGSGDFVCLGDVTLCGTGGPVGVCFCDVTVEGAAACVADSSCNDSPPCATTQDCPAGSVCAETCCGRVCLAACPNPIL